MACSFQITAEQNVLFTDVCVIRKIKGEFIFLVKHFFTPPFVSLSFVLHSAHFVIF